MKRDIPLIARVVALFSALTFVVLLSASISSFVIARQFFRAEPYRRALVEVNAYERAPGILADLFVNTVSGARMASQLPLPELNQADVELFLSILLPRQWLQSQTEVVVQRATDELNGESPAQPALLSLTELKEQLSGTAGRDALLAIINTRPACGPIALEAFTCGFALDGMITCRPPSLNQEICGSAIDLATAGIASQIPDQIDLDAVLQFSDPLTAPIRDHARRYVTVVSLLGRFGWLAALPFLLLTTVLAVRSFSSWLRWWGAPLVGVALCLLPLVALTMFWPTWYVAAPLEELATTAPALSLLLSDVAAVLSRGLVLQLVVVSALFGIAGAGMVALSFIAPAVQRWVAQG